VTVCHLGLTIIAAVVRAVSPAKVAQLRCGAPEPAAALVVRARDARGRVIRRKRRPICAVHEVLVELEASVPVGQVRAGAVFCRVDQGRLARRVLEACLLADHLLRGRRARAVVPRQTLLRPLLVDPHAAEHGALVPQRDGAGVGAAELVGELGGTELEGVGKVVEGGGVE